MWQDPIVAELRQAREAHAARFDFDLQAICRDLKEQEEQSQREKASFAPKRIPPIKAEIKSALAS
jgi:hypothetical protein